MLLPGLHIGQQLAGVELVGQCVNHRNAGVAGDLFDDIVAKGPHHDDIEH